MIGAVSREDPTSEPAELLAPGKHARDRHPELFFHVRADLIRLALCRDHAGHEQERRDAQLPCDLHQHAGALMIQLIRPQEHDHRVADRQAEQGLAIEPEVGVEDQVVELKVLRQGMQALVQARDVVAFEQDRGHRLKLGAGRDAMQPSAALDAELSRQIDGHLADLAPALDEFGQGVQHLFLPDAEQRMQRGRLHVRIQDRDLGAVAGGEEGQVRGQIALARAAAHRVDGNEPGAVFAGAVAPVGCVCGGC